MIVTAIVLSTFSSAALMISLMTSSGPSSILDYDHDDDRSKNASCSSPRRGLSNRRKSSSVRRLHVNEPVELEDYIPGTSS